MEAVANTTSSNSITNPSTANQLTENTGSADKDSIVNPANDFSAFMRKALGRDDSASVNEEELFAALIDQRLQKLNPEAANLYRQEKDKFMKILARPDGHAQVEDVAKAALETTVAAGKIDEATADKINAEAFAAAQLDDNHDALYDSIGGGHDTTIAIDQLSLAMAKTQAMIEKIDSGELTVTARSLLTPSNSIPASNSTGLATQSLSSKSTNSTELNSADGTTGFLWKPISDSDGKLVVLLPSALNGQIDKVELHSGLPPSETTKLDSGRFTSIANGNRSHYRFSKPGADYGRNVQVVVFKNDGTYLNFPVNDGSKRVD